MIFQKIKSKIKNFVTSKKINIFLLFLVLAFCILLLTKLSKKYTNTFVFSLQNMNIPEDKVLLADSTLKLEITMKAFGFELLPFYLKSPKVNIDFSEYKSKRDSTYIWTKTKNFAKLHAQFSDRVELVNIQPDTMLFTFDSYQVKKVPVQVQASIDFTSGFDFSSSFKVVPDSVKIIGPHAIVSKINAVKTDSLIKSAVNKSISQDFELQKPFDNIKFTHQKVTVSAAIEKHTEGVLKIPVTIINKPEDVHIKYFPKAVNVSYYTSLKNFNNIQASDFKVTCDFSTVTEDTEFLTPKVVVKPNLAKYVKMNQKQIEFIITK